MRVLFLNTDYPRFLAWLYRRAPSLSLRPYDVQMAARNASFFGTADFMSAAFVQLGHNAIDVHANNRPMAEAWAAEHGLGRVGWAARAACCVPVRRIASRALCFDARAERFREILAAHVAAFQPDVLYNHDPTGFSAEWLRSILPKDCALVAQIASPRGDATDWHSYDLVISSLPNFVAWFRANGVSAEYLPLAFESRLLAAVGELPRDIPLSFVGSLSPAHRERLAFLERVAAEDGLAVWGDGIDQIAPTNILRRYHRGEAWGPEMFALLRRSQLTLNKHIDISEKYANNMRLFEATGMGACLVTDWKGNLATLFEPGKEVVAYRSAEECLDLLRYYALHDAERAVIAAAGQRRCLAEHGYERRMAQLADLLRRHFG